MQCAKAAPAWFGAFVPGIITSEIQQQIPAGARPAAWWGLRACIANRSALNNKRNYSMQRSDRSEVCASTFSLPVTEASRFGKPTTSQGPAPFEDVRVRSHIHHFHVLIIVIFVVVNVAACREGLLILCGRRGRA